jgi:hypothetical protein
LTTFSMWSQALQSLSNTDLMSEPGYIEMILN